MQWNNIYLNPSKIDGCGEGAWWNRRGLQASLEGNHDNPVSGTHQVPSHWKIQWKKVQILTKKSIQRGGRVGGKKQLEIASLGGTHSLRGQSTPFSILPDAWAMKLEKPLHDANQNRRSSGALSSRWREAKCNAPCPKTCRSQYFPKNQSVPNQENC